MPYTSTPATGIAVKIAMLSHVCSTLSFNKEFSEAIPDLSVDSVNHPAKSGQILSFLYSRRGNGGTESLSMPLLVAHIVNNRAGETGNLLT